MPKSHKYTKYYGSSNDSCKPCGKKPVHKPQVLKPVHSLKLVKKEKCECQDADFEVKVNNLFSDILNKTETLINYEIALINKSCQKIKNLSIEDNLAGLNLLDGVTISVNTDSETVTIADQSDLDKGVLLNPCESYLGPCDVVRISVQIVSPPLTVTIGQNIENTVYVDGCVQHHNSKPKCPGEPCTPPPPPPECDSCDPCDCKCDCDCNKKEEKCEKPKKKWCKSKIHPKCLTNVLLSINVK